MTTICLSKPDNSPPNYDQCMTIYSQPRQNILPPIPLQPPPVYECQCDPYHTSSIPRISHVTQQLMYLTMLSFTNARSEENMNLGANFAIYSVNNSILVRGEKPIDTRLTVCVFNQWIYREVSFEPYDKIKMTFNNLLPQSEYTLIIKQSTFLPLPTHLTHFEARVSVEYLVETEGFDGWYQMLREYQDNITITEGVNDVFVSGATLLMKCPEAYQWFKLDQYVGVRCRRLHSNTRYTLQFHIGDEKELGNHEYRGEAHFVKVFRTKRKTTKKTSKKHRMEEIRRLSKVILSVMKTHNSGIIDASRRRINTNTKYSKDNHPTVSTRVRSYSNNNVGLGQPKPEDTRNNQYQRLNTLIQVILVINLLQVLNKLIQYGWIVNERYQRLRRNRTRQENMTISNIQSEILRVNILMHTGQPPLIRQYVRINSIERMAIIDTGSQVTTIPYGQLSILERLSIQSSNDVIMTLNSVVSTYGTLTCSIAIDTETIVVTAMIIHSEEMPPIIGIDAIRQFDNAVVHPTNGIIIQTPFRLPSPSVATGSDNEDTVTSTTMQSNIPQVATPPMLVGSIPYMNNRPNEDREVQVPIVSTTTALFVPNKVTETSGQVIDEDQTSNTQSPTAEITDEYEDIVDTVTSRFHQCNVVVTIALSRPLTKITAIYVALEVLLHEGGLRIHPLQITRVSEEEIEAIVPNQLRNYATCQLAIGVGGRIQRRSFTTRHTPVSPGPGAS